MVEHSFFYGLQSIQRASPLLWCVTLASYDVLSTNDLGCIFGQLVAVFHVWIFGAIIRDVWIGNFSGKIRQKLKGKNFHNPLKNKRLRNFLEKYFTPKKKGNFRLQKIREEKIDHFSGKIFCLYKKSGFSCGWHFPLRGFSPLNPSSDRCPCHILATFREKRILAGKIAI